LKSTDAKLLAAAKAEDVQDLLNHIAWTETIEPALIKQREVLSALLVQSTLGYPVEMNRTDGSKITVSKEQLAGRISGINFITKFLEDLLKNGQAAMKSLNDIGIR
jgi:hypothetical protein